MERKIGEKFDYNGVKLEVCVANAYINAPCRNCYFLHNEKCFKFTDITGKCSDTFREDKRSVYFKEVK